MEQERVDEVVSRMEQTGGDHAQAAFEGLVSDPELVGTDALARAWLTWAERRAVDRSAADDDEVLRATARAYALSRTAETVIPRDKRANVFSSRTKTTSESWLRSSSCLSLTFLSDSFLSEACLSFACTSFLVSGVSIFALEEPAWASMVGSAASRILSARESGVFSMRSLRMTSCSHSEWMSLASVLA